MRRTCAAAAAVLALSLVAGCGGGAASPSGAKPSGGPPPGGWPKPVNGKLTAAMCGLLTGDDYQRYGHMRLGSTGETRLASGPNVVGCSYQGEDGLTLNLQPGVLPAGLLYKMDLTKHEHDRGAGAPAPATKVVPGADESWYDLAGDNVPGGQQVYELELRRGSLVADLKLGWLKTKGERDPRTILTGLAALLLKRTTIGGPGAGTYRTLHYAVRGHGTLRLLTYANPNTADSIDKKNVKLPWSTDFPIVEQGTSQPQPQLTAAANFTPLGPPPPVACTITVNHKQIAQDAETATATCTGSLN
ncbi:MAG TPA: hypothetical protein VGL93_24580 [Streptosporangiaceae bacterium]